MPRFCRGAGLGGTDGKAGIIDPTGKITFTAGSKPPEGHWSKFTGGLARAYSQGKWGYVDKSGQFLIEPRFDYTWDFSGPTAVVHLGERSLVIDRTGKVVVEMEIPARLEETFDGLTSFTPDGNYSGFCGYLRQDGHPLPLLFQPTPFGRGGSRSSPRVWRGLYQEQGWLHRPPGKAGHSGHLRRGRELCRRPGSSGRRPPMVLIDKNGKVVKDSPLSKASGGKRKSSE